VYYYYYYYYYYKGGLADAEGFMDELID